MTVTETEQDITVMGVHVIYRDAEYSVGQVGSYFLLLSQIWNACV
jgi:hypothetical protein